MSDVMVVRSEPEPDLLYLFMFLFLTGIFLIFVNITVGT